MTRATDDQDVRERQAFFPRIAASAARFAARNRTTVVVVAIALVVAAAVFLAKAPFEPSSSVESMRMARFLAKRVKESDSARLEKIPPILVVVEKVSGKATEKNANTHNENSQGDTQANAQGDSDDGSFAVALDEIARELDEVPETHLETIGLDDESFLGKRAYFYPQEELENAVELGRIARAIERQDYAAFELPAAARRLADARDPNAIETFAEDVLQTFDSSFRNVNAANEPDERNFEPSLPDALVPQYWRLSPNGDLAMATLEFDESDADANARDSRARQKNALEAVDAILARAAERRPDFRYVVTGLAALDRAEANALRPLLIRAVIFGALVALALFWLAFSPIGAASKGDGGLGFFRSCGRLTRAALCLIASAAPVVVVETVVYAANGRLQPLDLLAAFPVFAFGTAAAALWFAQYGALRKRIRALEVAVETTNALVGRALACAAIALICAALAWAISCEARRVVGLAIALGALVSLASTLVLAPAAIILCESARPFKSAAPIAQTPYAFALRRPKLVLVVTLALIAPVVVAASKIDRAPTSLGLVDDRLPESAALERATNALGYYPALRADVMLDADSDDFTSLKTRLAEDGSILVDDPFATAPKITADQKAIVGELAVALAPLAPALPNLPPPKRDEFMQALDLVDSTLEFNASTLDENERFDYDSARAALADARRAVEACDERDFAPLAQRLQRVEALDLLARIFTLRDSCSAEPPTVDDLSPALKARRIDPATGRPTMRVYSRKDLTRRSALAAFVGNVGAATSDSAGTAPALFNRASDADAALIFAFAIWTLAFLASTGWSLGSLGTGLLASVPSVALVAVSLGIAGRMGAPFDELSFITPIAVLVGSSVFTRSFDGTSQASEETEDAGARYSSPTLAGATTGAAFGWLGALALCSGYSGCMNVGAQLATSALAFVIVEVFATPAIARLRDGTSRESEDEASEETAKSQDRAAEEDLE